jgi:anthranilate/para-aminobenzoate synthase component I
VVISITIDSGSEQLVVAAKIAARTEHPTDGARRMAGGNVVYPPGLTHEKPPSDRGPSVSDEPAGPRLVVERVAVSPDPMRLARRLVVAGLPEVALLHAAATTPRRKAGWGRASWLVGGPDNESHAIDPLEDDDEAPRSGPLAASPRWLGVIPYEARRDALERPDWRPEERRAAPHCERPVWRRYPAAVHIEPGRPDVRVVGVDVAAVKRLAKALQVSDPPAEPPVALTVRAPESAERHRARIERARELILDGHLYQVNLARRLDLTAPGADPWGIYAALHARAPAAFGAVLPLENGWWALSTSPELVLEAIPVPTVAGAWPGWSRLSTEPIKGTRPRGANPDEDAALVAELESDPKERAELAMIVDVERNDLSSVCRVGTVRVSQSPAVVTHPTVHHRVARVVGEGRADVSRRQILEAMLPSGSVTGAPKQRAMEVIAELESERRGLYTGALGYLSHDGGARLAMAIRCAVVKDGRGHYWTGGGIVAGSDPDREVEETRWKARQIGEVIEPSSQRA